MSQTKASSGAAFESAQSVQATALLDYQDGSIASREILNSSNGKIKLLAFDAGQCLNEHTSPYNVVVLIMEGEAEITISGTPHRLREGELILMPAQQPHALKALKRFKMILTMIRP